MRSRYDGQKGKEAAIANQRQNRLEREHMEKNNFVKKSQAELAKHAGTKPDLKNEAMEFNAYMCNNGQHAQMFAKELTKGIDEVAFPVKPADPKE